MKRSIQSAGIVFCLLFAVAQHASAQSIKVEHKPVEFGLKGQSITLKAQVSGGEGGIETVTLFYALFRDAAPFRITMSPSGMNLFIGTIDASMLKGASTVSYYMEALDKGGSIEETPWYEVVLKDPDVVTAPAPITRPAPPPIVAPTAGDRNAGSPATRNDKQARQEGYSATTLGLIAGGAVAVAGAAYLVSDSGSGGGGGSSGTDNSNGEPVDAVAAAGTYAGSATTCLAFGDNPPQCSTMNVSIFIDDTGIVLTDNLLPGTQLRQTLNGNRFTLVGDVDDPSIDQVGTVIYSGTVVDNRIIGSISGSAQVGVDTGTYSGSFTLNKQ